MLLTLTLAGVLLAQAVQYPESWNVGWRAAVDSQGRAHEVPVFIWAGGERAVGRYAVRPEISVVVRLDDEFRRARKSADAAALERILDDTYRETAADGAQRDKRTAIAFLVAARPDAVGLERLNARMDGSAVVMTAVERTTIGANAERIMATRTYSRDARGEWRLLSSTVSAARQEGKPPAGDQFVGVWSGSWDGGGGGGGGFELTLERDKEKGLTAKVSVTGEPTYTATLSSVAFDGAKMTGKYDFPEDTSAEVVLTATFEDKAASGSWSLREKSTGNEVASGGWKVTRKPPVR